MDTGNCTGRRNSEKKKGGGRRMEERIVRRGRRRKWEEWRKGEGTRDDGTGGERQDGA